MNFKIFSLCELTLATEKLLLSLRPVKVDIKTQACGNCRVPVLKKFFMVSKIHGHLTVISPMQIFFSLTDQRPDLAIQ